MAAPVYDLDPNVDLPVIVSTATTWVTLQFIVDEGPPPGPAPDSVNALDSIALNRWDPAIATASDVTVYTVGAAGLVTAYAIGRNGHGGLAAPVVMIESWTVNGLTVEILKQATDRTRPFVSYSSPSDEILTAQAEHDAAMSFPSGHTAFSAVTSFGAARMLDDADVMPGWLAYTGATIVTASIGTMRVLAGKHYPTDVIVGGSIGAAYGLLFPAIHHKKVDLEIGARGVVIQGTW
jgi:hypothetical protein